MIPVVDEAPVRKKKAPRQIPKIFLTYRIFDSQSATGRVRDHLVERFGEENIFQDVEGIGPGEFWNNEIPGALQHCDVQLVFIGAHFFTQTDAAGTNRLFKDGDWVAGEIQHGLERSKAADATAQRPTPALIVIEGGDAEAPRAIHPLKVIPVIVDGALWPFPPDQLPERIRGLVEDHQVFVLRNTAYDRDLRALLRAIRKRGAYVLGVPKRVLVRVVAAVATLAVIAGVFVATRPASKLGLDTFNVAVADFAVVDEAGRAVRSDLGRRYARALSAGLSAQMSKALTPTLRFGDEVRVWKGSAGTVKGVDADERTASAASIGRRTGADLVLYGTLVDDGSHVSVEKPELVLAKRRLTGDLIALFQYTFAAQPSEDALRSDSPAAMARPLTAQTSSMVRLLAALGRLRRDDTEVAAQIVAPLVGDGDPGWVAGRAANPERDALVEHVLGVREVRRTPAAGTSRAQWYAEGEAHLRKSLAIDPTFTPAELYQGRIGYLRSRGECSRATVDRAGLDAAAAQLRPLALADESIGDTRPKAAFAVGDIETCKVLVGLVTSAVARRFFGLVVAAQEDNPDLAALAANAHGEVAVLDARERYDFTGAIAELRTALDLMDSALEERLITGSRQQTLAPFEARITCVEGLEASRAEHAKADPGDDMQAYLRDLIDRTPCIQPAEKGTS